MHENPRTEGLKTDFPERQFLVRALLEVGERESVRIGQELHDHLCQVLLGAAFGAKAMAQSLPAGSPAAVDLDDLVRLITSAVELTRDIARGLAPLELDGPAFVASLERLVSVPRAGIAVRLECARVVPLTNARTALQLYRIAQEAIGNAVQHSAGSEIVVRVTSDERDLELEVADNGCGFGSRASDGLGIALMKYRAEVIGARLRFDSSDQGGARVRCSLATPM